MHRKNTKRVTRPNKKRNQRDNGKRLTKADQGVVTVIPSNLAFPTVTRAHLKYDSYFDLNTSVDVFTYYEFAANGCYDPDLSGTGHQPYMYDQYTDRYSKYRVIGFRYLVNVPTSFASSTTSAGVLRIGTQIRNDNYTPTYPAFFEQPYTKFKSASSGAPTMVLRGASNLTKISARPENYLNDDRYSSVYTSNPAELISFYVGAHANAEFTARIIVTLIYEVEFFDPHPTGTSLKGTPGVRLNKTKSLRNIKV